MSDNTLDLAALLAAAEENGQDFKTVRVTPGPYQVRVTHNKFNKSKAGNPGYSVRTVIEDGPDKGKGFWSNFYLTPTKKDGEPNHAGIAMFFKQLEAFGIDPEEVKRGLTVEQAIAENRLIGAIVTAEVEDNDYDKDNVKSRAKKFTKAASANAVPVVPTVAPPADAPPVTPGRPF